MKKQYQIILSDPPWHISKGGRRNVRPQQGRSLDYPTLDLPMIKDIHRAVIPMAATDHVLFL